MASQLEKYKRDAQKLLSKHYHDVGDKGIAWRSMAKIVVKGLTALLLISGTIFLFQDLRRCDCDHQHQHHHQRHHPRRTLAHHQRSVVNTQSQTHWQTPTLPAHLQRARQDDPELIQHIRDHWLLSPSSGHALQLSNPDRVDRSQAGQALCVDHLLGGKKFGMYLEAGASNGETFSNTLYLERFRNWTGILVEPNPEYFSELQEKHRDAILLNACLSPAITPMRLNFTQAKMMGVLEGFVDDAQMRVITVPKRNAKTIEVQCFPVYSVLQAAGQTSLDYLSLDVQGPEELILQTMPFDSLNVSVLSIAYRISSDKASSQAKLDRIEHYLDQFGYQFAGKLMRLDAVFKKGAIGKTDSPCFPQRTKNF